MATVPRPNSKAVIDMLPKAWGSPISRSTIEPEALLPTRGYSCCRMMMTPIPLMKPDRTGYGM